MWVSSIVAALVLLAGYKGCLMPKIDESYLWFQRSGSIVILLAIIAELFVIERLKSVSDEQEIEARKRFKKGINISNALVIIIGLVGTVVWGYGDLIYKSLN